MTNNPTIDGVSRYCVGDLAASGQFTATVVRAEDYDAAQATIAQLEAKIAELERGRGDAVAWQRKSKMTDGQWFELPAEHVSEAVELGYEVRKLYTAPPAPVAPVAVVLPERKPDRNRSFEGTDAEWYGDIAWNACLDATAALNAAQAPGSPIKVMRGPCGTLYLSGIEDLREGDVFRREVRS